jgi:enoyl-CoA hydratase/carnithine racemase
MAEFSAALPVIDHLDADRFSALGEAPVLIVDAARFVCFPAPVQAVIIGIDHDGALPPVDAADFDLLLTTAPNPARPWVGLPGARFMQKVEALAQAVRTWPVAATMTCQTLRITEALPFDRALMVESFAYSTVLAGGELARWRTGRTLAASMNANTGRELVRYERDEDQVVLTLDSPETRNAMTAAMRDALYGALANVLDDPTWPDIVLQGAGKCFSTGGALAEFGTAVDVAQAHIIRTLHACARAVDALGCRITARLHGACIGSGLEIPASAARCEALAGSFFQLPELRMGLMPGAGGTASVTRRIGRHRTLWMVLSGERLGVQQALDYGLIDAVRDTPWKP